MKKIAYLAALLALSAPARAQERTFTPFFDFGLSEAVFVPGGQDVFFSGAHMKADVGLLTVLDGAPLFRKLPGKHSLFGLYTFNYDGPGFQPQDQGEFQYRSLSHNFNAEYRWKFLGPLQIRPGVGYTKSYVRTGANEVWGQGLYDSNSVGGQLALDYIIPHGKLTIQALLRNIAYPNFTDLLREFQSAGVQSQTSGGLQDNTMTEYSASVSWKKLFAAFRYTNQSYTNQTVVESNGVYGSDKQTGHSVSGDLGFVGKLWRFEIQPKGTITKYDSNQNFLDFHFFGDPNPTFYSDWYSYTELRGEVPLYLNLTEAGTALFGDVAVIQRNYATRVARDVNNVSTGELQNNLMVTLTGGLRFRINEVSFMKLSAGVINASSNNHFERYLPYNYTGTTAGISFDMAY